jgi:hypothetical protein
MKSKIIREVTLCSPVEINKRFGSPYCLNLQSRRVSQAIKQQKQKARSCRVVGPPKRRWTSTGIQRVIS